MLLKLKNKTKVGVPKTADFNTKPDQFYNGNPLLLMPEPKQKAPKVNSKENIKEHQNMRLRLSTEMSSEAILNLNS